MVRRAASMLTVLSVVFAVSHGQAQERGLADVLEPLIEKAGLPGELGIDIVRLSDARQLYTRNADQALNPASNLKLLTAAATLRAFGPAHQFATSLHGVVDGGRVWTLVVRGGGDPSLRSRDVGWLANQLVARGIERIDRIAFDVSVFDDQRLPPAFEQQPDETASFRASVGALSIDRNAYVLHVRPGATVGEPAELHVWANQYISVRNRTTTTAKGRARVRIKHRRLADGRMRVDVAGGVPRRATTLTYRKRIEDPLAHAKTVFTKVLRRAGLTGAMDLVADVPRTLPPTLVEWHSPPLSEVLYAVGKWSDNFTAEMLLKSLGTLEGSPGTSAAGAKRVRSELDRLGVNTSGLQMINGSGLFRGNFVKPAQIAQTLRAMSRTPAVSNEYFAQLAIGGVDGTLQARLRDLPDGVTVRAKTGTLSDVVALSGYILPGVRRHAVAFSIIANGTKGRTRDTKALVDAIVTATATWLKRETTR